MAFLYLRVNIRVLPNQTALTFSIAHNCVSVQFQWHSYFISLKCKLNKDFIPLIWCRERNIYQVYWTEKCVIHRAMGQTPSTMKPYKTRPVWRHLTEIKKGLIAGEDCSQLGHCMISEPRLSSLFPLCQLPKKQSTTHTSKEWSSTSSPPSWEIVLHIGWESVPLKKDAGCTAGAQGCVSVPIYYSRTPLS